MGPWKGANGGVEEGLIRMMQSGCAVHATSFSEAEDLIEVSR